MKSKFPLLASAITLAISALATSAIAADQPLHIVNWHGSDLPKLDSEYLITKEEADKYANNNSWFAVVDVNQNASGTIDNLNMSVKTEGTESQKQFMAIDVEDGDIEFGGETFDLSVETGFKGTGNNQATAVLVENGSTFRLSADTSNINVTSTNVDGKSVYGLAAQGKDSLISVTGKETNIILKTNTNRNKDNPTNGVTTYSEAPAINAADGGKIHFAEGTKLNISVESTGDASSDQWTASNVNGQDGWIGNYWGGSPAYGIKLEGGQGIFEGDVAIDVKSNAGRAIGVATTNYFATSEWDQVWNDAAGHFNNLTISTESKSGQALGIDVSYGEGKDNKVMLSVDGDTHVVAKTETGSAQAIKVSGKTAAQFEGNIYADVTSTNSDITRGISAQQGAKLTIGAKGQTETVSVNLNNQSKNVDDSLSVGLMALRDGSSLEVNTQNLIITGEANGWIYGISSQNSTTEDKGKLASVIINADKTVIDVKSTGQASSGIVAMSQGQIEINSDLYVKADDVIVTRGFASTTINKDREAITQLDGNIKFDYDVKTSKTAVDANVFINLTGENSYWNGNTLVAWNGNPKESELEVNDMTLSLSDNAQWNPTVIEDSDNQSAIALNNLEFDDGVINVRHGARQLVNIEHMTGTGGTVNLTATTEDGETLQSGSLEVAQAESGMNLDVNAVGITSDDIKNPEKALASLNEKVVAEKVAKTNTFLEGDVIGAISQTVNANGELGEITFQENTKLLSMKGVNAAALVAWRDEVAYTNQRLEFLRDASHAYGAWAQVYGGESSYDDASVDLKSTTVQVGADAALGDWVVGGAFSYMKGDADMNNGSADTDAYTLALYTARQFDSGLFVNGMARYGRLSTDATAGNMTGSYDNNAFSVGGNVGYRFTFAQQAFVEPQFGLQYAYVTGDDYTATNGVKVEQDNFDALVASLGARIGFNFAEDAGKVFARASVNHDFLGEVDGTASNDKAIQNMYVDLGGTWVTYGVGTQFNFTDNLSVWGNVDRTTGGEVSTHYMMNAGLRYTF